MFHSNYVMIFMINPEDSIFSGVWTLIHVLRKVGGYLGCYPTLCESSQMAIK